MKIYDAKALGAGKATIDTTKGPALYIMDGVSEVDTEIALTSNVQNDTGVVNLPPNKASVTFNKAISWSSKSKFSGYSGTAYHFMDKVTISGYTFGTWGKAHFHGVVDIGYWSGSANEFHFYVAGNKASQFHFVFPIYCHAENAFIKDYRWFAFSGIDSNVDLGGFDQRMESCYGWNYSTRNTYCLAQPSTSCHGFTSTDKAIMTFALKNPTEGTSGPVTETWHGIFSGKAGMCWNPVDSRSSFTFTNIVQTTAGELHVSNGTVRVTCGAGLPNLSKLVVGSNGRLVFETSASATSVTNLEVVTGSQLEIPEGYTLTVTGTATKDGGTALVDGKYDESCGFFTGGGTLEVDTRPKNTFQREAGSYAVGDWSDPMRWSLGRVPQANDSVRIPKDSGRVRLAAASPEFYKFTLEIGAELLLTGWDTKLNAKYVTIDGTVKTADSVKGANDAPDCRVWIGCQDLTISSTGAINLDSLGWSGYCGPGCWPSSRNVDNCGAAHGGHGALYSLAGRYDYAYGLPYDDPYAPSLPGSGGFKSGTRGGGAVRIEATGAVRIDGKILASAGASPSIATADGSGAYVLCGSGGAIWITCATFSGRGGVLRADGGDAGIGCPPYLAWNLFGTSTDRYAAAGGGGMIRIEYGAGQSAATLEDMTVSAAGGIYRGYANGTKAALSVANNDLWQTEPDLGTLTFTDLAIVRQLLGKGLSGRLIDVSEYTHVGDLVWTNGHVRFAGEGANVTVTGDLTVTGDRSRLEVGGCLTRTNLHAKVDRWGGTALNRLTVGGDFTVTAGAAFDIRAAETNATMRWGGEVAVGGDMTVGSGAYVYPWCDISNLGAPHFTVAGDFTVAAGGAVCADHRGGAGSGQVSGFEAFNASALSKGYGPGGGLKEYCSASYGGLGGKALSYALDASMEKEQGSPGTDYGDAYFPQLPGSGGGVTQYNIVAGAGGGLVYIEAQGAVTVDGRISADGQEAQGNIKGRDTTVENYSRAGAGSGGTVYVAGKSFSGTGVVSARGGESLVGRVDGTSGVLAGKQIDYVTAGGGGGRISIGVGYDLAETGRVRKSETSAHGDIAPLYSFTGSYDVTGGTNVCGVAKQTLDPLPQYSVTHGAPGTVRYVGWTPKKGLCIIFR